jgi:hypothetical protein
VRSGGSGFYRLAVWVVAFVVGWARVAFLVSFVMYIVLFFLLESFLGGFLLLTWEFASLDGYAAVCGEVLGEELRLCGLA